MFKYLQEQGWTETPYHTPPQFEAMTLCDNEKAAASMPMSPPWRGENEFEMFTKSHPDARVLTVASTGAAALMVYDENAGKFDELVKTDMAYASLFKDMLGL